MGTDKDEQAHGPDEPSAAVVGAKYADETLRLVEQYGQSFGSLTAEREKQLRRKCYWHVMGLLLAINLLLFVSHFRDIPSHMRTCFASASPC